MLRIVIYTQLSFLILFTAQIRAETLTIASDIWCPYICDNKQRPGILVEVLREIAEVKQLNIRFEIIPLSRSLMLASLSKVDVVLAITQSHIVEFKLQQSQQYFGGWNNDFYIRTSDDFALNKLDDIENLLYSGKTLGIIKGYEYGPYIDDLKLKYATNIYQATGNNPLVKNIKMLQKGRISALLDSRYNVEYEIKENEVTDIKYVGSEGDFVPLFLGFSPTIKPQTINRIDDGFLLIRHKGILKNILGKYGVSDWQQPK